MSESYYPFKVEGDKLYLNSARGYLPTTYSPQDLAYATRLLEYADTTPNRQLVVIDTTDSATVNVWNGHAMEPVEFRRVVKMEER